MDDSFINDPDWFLHLPDWSAVGVTSWDYPFFDSSIQYNSYFSFSFDQDRNLTKWFGYSLEGGSESDRTSTNDVNSFFYGDYNGWGDFSGGPGVWKKTVLFEETSPVPLGGSLGMAVIGLIGIGFASRRRIKLTA